MLGILTSCKCLGGHARTCISILLACRPMSRRMRTELVREAYQSVMYAIAHASRTFGLNELHHDVMQHC